MDPVELPRAPSIPIAPNFYIPFASLTHIILFDPKQLLR